MKKLNGIPIGQTDSRYLKLDQTTPQMIINGIPILNVGIQINSVSSLTSPLVEGIIEYAGNDFYLTVKDPPSPGFILVPGSATYGTSDFYVMKYGAKRVGSSTMPISTAAGLPWVNISQTTAATNSANMGTGYHLWTEAEFLTIAQNVLSVASNWSGGSVGSGYIPRGNSNSGAATDATTDLTGVNKRTLTLTNGEVIWDLAGNVWEWTSGTSTTGQPGVAGNAYAAWIQWPNVTTPGTLSPNVFPSGTGISGASGWNSSNGIGMLISNPAETGARGFLRGGPWNDGGTAGVLTLRLSNVPSSTAATFGFRVSR